MHQWYYDIPSSPRGLAELSDRQRSERAAWRSALWIALRRPHDKAITPTPTGRRAAIRPAATPRPSRPVPDAAPVGEAAMAAC